MQSERARILCVDDEESNLITLSYALDDMAEVITTTSPNEALRRLRDEDFALLITDHRMPEMSGVELCAQSRTVSPSTIRIILTAYSDVHAAIDAVNHGAVSRYLKKPINAEELLSAVRDALELAEADQGARDLQLALLRTRADQVTQAVEARVARELGPALGRLGQRNSYLQDLLAALRAASEGDQDRIRMEAEQCADEISSDVSGLQTIATRLQRGERSPSKAKTELGRVLRALTALGNRPVRLVGEARLFVAIDPADLGAILISLIERALMVSPRVELRYREHEAGALVEVSDETALTQSALESLFDPYANTLPGGDGRSLALARELAIESGGSLSAEVDGEATRVSLVLPRTD